MRFCVLVFGLLFFTACAATRRADRRFCKKLENDISTSPVFSRSFTGFHLQDAASGQTLAAFNADRHFTPASNTKILTLATCLKVLGDSIPGIRWKIENDTFCFRGTADPTFLHPYFEQWQPVMPFLRQQTPPLLCLQLYADYMERFGPGWAWDDYLEYYSVERSAFPAYGNAVMIGKKKGEAPRVLYPESFHELHLTHREGLKSPRIVRTEDHSPIHVQYDTLYTDSIEFERTIPLPLGEFRDPPLRRYPPNPWLHIQWESTDATPGTNWQVLNSCPVDTVYRRMMYESDNFVAEQLLLVCAGVKYDTLQQEKIIPWVKDSLFGALANPPRWVDGSGLSRYNLITPRYLTGVLQHLYREQPLERLCSLFPAGGVAGTLATWYHAPDGQPFVFAKSGSMSGVQCLSGYLLTRRGKVLIFSFMHNNFTGSGKPWKQEMQRILLELHNRL